MEEGKDSADYILIFVCCSRNSLPKFLSFLLSLQSRSFHYKSSFTQEIFFVREDGSLD